MPELGIWGMEKKVLVERRGSALLTSRAPPEVSQGSCRWCAASVQPVQVERNQNGTPEIGGALGVRLWVRGCPYRQRQFLEEGEGKLR